MIDIKAAQTEANSKASAWLAQNLPAEEAPPVVVQPVTPVPAQVPPETPKVETPAAPVIAKPGLAESIRADREARAKAAAATGEATKYKGELETIRKENEALKAQVAATDPFDFLRARKLTKEQQALWGQAFLYDLKPEVAPPEFRLDLYKAEQARKEAETKAAQEREAQERAAQEEQGRVGQYASELYKHIQTSPGSNPESESWFTEEAEDGTPQVNHRAYAQSLLATANNLAQRAQKSGQQVDLSPANVARVLEAEVSKRMKRRDAKLAGSAKPETKQVPQAGQNGKPAVETTTSAQGLRSGAPVVLDMSDKARAERAAAVLFGTK